MSTLQQVAFVIAFATTLILLVQIILMFVGAHGDSGLSDAGDAGDIGDSGDFGGGDIDVDVDGAGDLDLDVDVDADVSDGVDLDTDTGGDISSDGDGDIPAASGKGGFAPFGLKLLSLRSILAFVVMWAWSCYTLEYFLDWYWAVLISVGIGFGAACAMAGALVGMEKLQSSGNINIKNAVGKVGTVYLTIPAKRGGFGKVNVLVQERYAEYDAITDNDEPIPTSSEIIVTGVANNMLIVKPNKKKSIVIETVK